jgi:hypothetical protein
MPMAFFLVLPLLLLRAKVQVVLRLFLAMTRVKPPLEVIARVRFGDNVLLPSACLEGGRTAEF